MKKIIIICITALLLSGCGLLKNEEFKPKSQVTVNTTQSWPDLPDVPDVPALSLLPWKNDVPRDKTKLIIKNVEICKAVPKEKQDAYFWSKCGEYEPIPDSNIFVGFDQENWNIIQENFSKLKERIFQYQQRIDEVNKQRREWRRLNEEERARIKALEQKEPTE